MEASPIGKLAGELRNRIYELVLNPPEGIDIESDSESGEFGLPPTPNQVFALARTCKQIHHETRAFTYSDNKFCLHYGGFRLPLGPSGPRTLLSSNEARIARYHTSWLVALQAWCSMMSMKGIEIRKIELILDSVNMETMRGDKDVLHYKLADTIARLVGDVFPSQVEVTLGARVRYTEEHISIVDQELPYSTFSSTDATKAKETITLAMTSISQE